MTRSRWLLLVAVVALAGLFVACGPDEQTVIRRSAEWRAAARDDLPAAVGVFIAAEVVLIGLSLPVGIWLTVLAGFLFGTWLGTAAVSVGATAGAVLSFLSARYLFAGAIHRAAQTRPRLGRWLAALDRGFSEHGAYYVLLLRLTPIFPFWTLNLGLGLTRVRLRDYWWATQLGMLPVTLVVTHAGASLAEVTALRDVLSWRVLGALCLMPLVPFVLHHTLGRYLSESQVRKSASPKSKTPSRRCF